MNLSTVPPKRSSSRAHARVVRLEQPPHVLRVHPLGSGGEADEVAEEAGDDLALLARRRLALDEPCAQLRAEARASSAFSRPQLGQVSMLEAYGFANASSEAKIGAVEQPETRYARSGDVNIAYQAVGEWRLFAVEQATTI